eukprot:4416272-Pyramimonas_sp.AAC.1
MRPRKVCRNGSGSAMQTQPLRPFDRAPDEAAKRRTGVPKLARLCHAATAIGAPGGAPYVATRRVRVCRNCRVGAMRAQPGTPHGAATRVR